MENGPFISDFPVKPSFLVDFPLLAAMSNITRGYPLVNKHSYGKWSFIMEFPIKRGDFL